MIEQDVLLLNTLLNEIIANQRVGLSRIYPNDLSIGRYVLSGLRSLWFVLDELDSG
ncbi:hypothetical protein IQ238_25435 [Pleurocapsales cyanobacterium LEGE 06147]|nr:hypothetical protein [Pleurocapsales cyanobacterium LEGE 06147]